MNHGLLVFIQHIPPLSLIPLLVLWFGIGETPKFLIIILATFFPIYLNMEDGLLRADPKLLEVGKTLGFSQRETLWKIRLPLALPTIVTGMRIGMGYSLRSIIGAEMIAADRGLGYFILDAQTMSRSDKVIVGILAIGLIGFSWTAFSVSFPTFFSLMKGETLDGLPYLGPYQKMLWSKHHS